MGQVVQVGTLSFGSGRPKICVPLVGRTEEELLAGAGTLAELGADLAEWRADYLIGGAEPERLREIGPKLRSALGGLPLLFTFRSSAEGGEQPCTPEKYREAVLTSARENWAELVDVELSAGAETVREVIATAHARGGKVIVSSHDFAATPAQEEMVRRLRRMEELGADLPKLAVMPRCQEDVLSLLGATLCRSREGTQPVITMSMGPLGAVSRLCGEAMGSCMTFGAAQRASAPGQIPVRQLKETLEALRISDNF